MGCFDYFKEKARSRYQRKSKTVSAPAAAAAPAAASPPVSAGGPTSVSDGLAAGVPSSLRGLPALFEERAHSLRVFELAELRSATNDFSRLLKIGEGGFGAVYRGFIKAADGKGEKTLVAVKKLNQNGLQGHKQWVAEVQFLGVLEHPNLVKLIGYCAVDSERGIQRLLVYEFVPNKTLEDHLFNKFYPILPWNIRLQIALGTAEGLAYLHEGLEIQVIYRDFKASNILLDEEFKPKLSDFGLAREGPAEGHTHVSTAVRLFFYHNECSKSVFAGRKTFKVMGTYGYAAPEYIETGHLTSKSDVWSFGVVLYEILTGRRSIERNRPRNEQKLLDWVNQYPVEGKRFHRIIEPRLENQYSMQAAKEIAMLANRCLSKQARDRPKMSEVVESLKQAMQLTEMVAPEDLEEEHSAIDSDTEKKDDQVTVAESLKRRMLHLARLGENANPMGMRKFMLMKTASPS